jgi:serine/threonine protein kinase
MFTSLEELHKKGIVHRDIKPENIMTCIGKHQLKIIDFGLAGYIHEIKNKRSSSLIGNVRYASRDGHLGQSSPKDDLEALVYCISYLTCGSLPWQNSKT